MDKDIIRLPKNQETEIVIRVDDFGGRRGVTIREIVKSERYTGFTKAGTRIPVEQFKAFKTAVNAIDEAELMMPTETQPTPRPQAGGTGGARPAGFAKKPEQKVAPAQKPKKAEKAEKAEFEESEIEDQEF